jgi:thiol-disulfide isomerase/thioredoxin
MVLWMVLWSTAGAYGAAGWSDDFDAALATAKAQNRFVLLDFTGSDWCGWCIKLDQEVFSKKEFKKFADERLVCVEVDFPAKKKLSSGVQKQNEGLKQRFGIRGYPTIIVLDPNGEQVAKTGYKAGGAEAYVEHLKTLIDPHAGKFGAVSGAAPGAGGGGTRVDAKAPRSWTSTEGSTLEASYHQRVGSMIELRRSNGSMVRIDLASLSEADHAFLKSIKAIP